MPVGVKLIVFKGRCGLGNRMLGFLKAGLYGHLSGRSLVVDWRDRIYSAGETNFFTRYFESPWVDPRLQIPDTDSVYPPVWRGRLRQSMYELMPTCNGGEWEGLSPEEKRARCTLDVNNLDYPEDVVVMHACAVDPAEYKSHAHRFPCQWPEESLLSRYLLQNALLVRSEVRQEILSFKARHFRPTMLGVHIRNTDNQSFPGMSISVDAFWPIVGELLRTHPDAGLFVATDNPSTLSTYQAAFPAVVATDKVFARNECTSLHRRADPILRDLIGKQAILDLYLLSACNVIVYSSVSSFGRVACCLASAGTRCVDVATGVDEILAKN